MTSNLSETIRVNIGKLLLIHEFKKMFPTLNSASFKKIEEDINHMAQEVRARNVIGIRNFWNLVNAMMVSYMLKDITRLVTSSQIDWSLTNSKIDDLRFTSDITKIEGFDIRRKTANEVYSYLCNHNDKLESIKAKTHQEFAKSSSRAMDPIIVERHRDNTLHVHDGNGRLLKAIVEKKDVIDAYIGTHNGASKSNHWVPTSYLMLLNEKAATTKSAADLLEEVLASSQNAKYEYEHRVLNQKGENGAM